jgi:predicted RNase H-like HicB family nuclease
VLCCVYAMKAGAQLAERIEIKMLVSAFLKRSGRNWVATAPRFGVVTQGNSRVDAERSLREALELWVESCVERGTLEGALREVGFRPVPAGSGAASADRVQVKVSRVPASEVIGSESEIEISIPAYQAAIFSQLSNAGLSL